MKIVAMYIYGKISDIIFRFDIFIRVLFYTIISFDLYSRL